MSEQLSKSTGLRGQVAGETSLSTVGKTGAGLTYRGYDVVDLAAHAEFEEIAFLLLRGHLPNQKELKDYKERLEGFRGLPKALKNVLEGIENYTPYHDKINHILI